MHVPQVKVSVTPVDLEKSREKSMRSESNWRVVEMSQDEESMHAVTSEGELKEESGGTLVQLGVSFSLK
jgi:hypothetical protein